MLTPSIEKRLDSRKKQNQYRQRVCIDHDVGNKVSVDGQQAINFSSNDYLGLSSYPFFNSLSLKFNSRLGFGNGASAFVSGYSSMHRETELQFSEWLGVDRAILFSSGYAANTGIINALCDRNSAVYSDKLCHASLLDGIMLSQAKHKRYSHNSLTALETLAQSSSPDLIITESIFSMEGDIAPINDLARLAKNHRSELLIDDAHGIGILGSQGRGVSEAFSLSQTDYSCIVYPLGKVFNAMGAIVAGRDEVIENITQFSRSYCYSTALPNIVCAAIQTSLQIIQQQSWRREKLAILIDLFNRYAKDKLLPLISYQQTPIKSILVHSNQRAIALQQWLLNKGFFLVAIRPPTVPPKKARLRVSLNCLHNEDQIMSLIDHIVEGLTQI